MNARIDRAVCAFTFLLIWLISMFLLFYIQDGSAKVGSLTIVILSTGGFAYSLARLVVRR